MYAFTYILTYSLTFVKWVSRPIAAQRYSKPQAQRVERQANDRSEAYLLALPSMLHQRKSRQIL